MNSTVSVIIPCYNQAHFLSDALHSILEQTYNNWECIIVNDGSPDNTETIAQDWCKKDDRFKYLYKENGGLSSARNYGINVAKGEYIVTLDADDKYEKTFLSKGVEILDNNKKIGVVSSWGYRFVGTVYSELFKPDGKNLNDFLFKNAAIGTSLFRKQCWIEVQGYDENMKRGYEDWEFYIRVGKKGWEIKIIEEPLFFYRQNPVSMRAAAVSNFDKEIRLYIFKKHKELYQNHFDETIEFLLNSIAFNKKNELKRINSIDFRLGNTILKPFRFLMKIIKK
ncbi:glycosyltransferase family 2 protein [Flavobacterium paronense]|uniref:Glycosyltransferase family 2 protein n=1 Tax=Flavobacterium paronense TaxID=1392775 RepID=A0ABV5GAQ1_9FLAO|nr:glycosyltransferase family 2 protein [Flavobacterium paronense]MDN3676705.1 glycosyltransferase family 2 protein [Flavobacterium paronense]